MTAVDEEFLQSNGFLFQKPGPAQLLAVTLCIHVYIYIDR